MARFLVALTRNAPRDLRHNQTDGESSAWRCYREPRGSGHEDSGYEWTRHVTWGPFLRVRASVRVFRSAGIRRNFRHVRSGINLTWLIRTIDTAAAGRPVPAPGTEMLHRLCSSWNQNPEEIFRSLSPGTEISPVQWQARGKQRGKLAKACQLCRDISMYVMGLLKAARERWLSYPVTKKEGTTGISVVRGRQRGWEESCQL